jgi:hypothetical protein
MLRLKAPSLESLLVAGSCHWVREIPNATFAVLWKTGSLIVFWAKITGFGPEQLVQSKKYEDEDQ